MNQVLHAPAAGVLTLSVKVDDVVKIGDVIGYVEEKQGASVPAPAPAPVAETPPSPQPSAPAPAAPQPSGFSARQTKEHFVADVKAPVAQPIQKPVHKPSAPKEKGSRPERRVKMSKIRRVIARRLVEAQQTTAMLTTFNEVDLTEVISLRERHKETFHKQHGVKLGFMSFFVKAVVSALEVIPEINAYIDGEDLVYREYYDIGIAVGTDRGLVVPVVRGCDSYHSIRSNRRYPTMPSRLVRAVFLWMTFKEVASPSQMGGLTGPYSPRRY